MWSMERLRPEDKIALSDIRYEKAKEMLHDALQTLNMGMYKTSVNRSYYAALHAARALLILKGADPVTHDGTIRILSLARLSEIGRGILKEHPDKSSII